LEGPQYTKLSAYIRHKQLTRPVWHVAMHNCKSHLEHVRVHSGAQAIVGTVQQKEGGGAASENEG
jgi:hypothetical protein